MNIFDQIPETSQKEIFTSLLSTDSVRIERIVSFGQKSPDGFWYDQPEHEWLLLLEGAAQLRIEAQLVDLAPGGHHPGRLSAQGRKNSRIRENRLAGYFL